jgi:hypothetical protein
MLNIQKNQIKKFVGVLKSMNAEYKIILPDGTTYGELKTPEPKPASNNRPGHRYAKGETRKYYEPYFTAKPLAVGEVLSIPYGPYHVPTLAQNVCSYAHSLFGKGNYATERNKKAKTVDVMRLG